MRISILKIDIFRQAVEIVNSFGIRVFRTGCYKNKKKSVFKNLDDKMHGIIFPYFIMSLDKYISDTKIIPIMDGVDSQISKIFSKHIQSLDILRRTSVENSMPVKNSQNIYGEVFYGDSQYSVFVQLVDLISYCMQCLDYKSIDRDLTSFKSKIITEAEKIEKHLIVNEIYDFKINNGS